MVALIWSLSGLLAWRLWSWAAGWSLLVVWATFPRPVVLGALQLAALKAIVYPNHSGCPTCGGFIRCKSNLTKVGKSVEAFAWSHHGEFPLSLAVLEDSPGELPTCPVSQRPYQYRRTGADFELCCGGFHHEAVGIFDPDYPRYYSGRGLVER